MRSYVKVFNSNKKINNGKETAGSNFFVYPETAVAIFISGFPSGKLPAEIVGGANVRPAVYVDRISIANDGKRMGSTDGDFWVAESGTQSIDTIATCCNWSFDACHTVGIITIPGAYRLRPNHSSLSGVLYVEFVILKNEEVITLPRSTIFGD